VSLANHTVSGAFAADDAGYLVDGLAGSPMLFQQIDALVGPEEADIADGVVHDFNPAA
jgi:hypothetical protein